MADRYCYSSNEEIFNGGECATREEAIAEAIAEGIVDPGAAFWTGIQEPPAVAACFDADQVLEHLSGLADDSDPTGDFAADWPVFPAKDSDARRELDAIVAKFNETIDAWVVGHFD